MSADPRPAAAHAGRTSLERLLLRDRVAIVTALFAIAALAWLYMLRLAAGMSGAGTSGMTGMADMAGMAMASAARTWSPADVTLTLVMWWVMMVGMMTPSAAPMLLTFATVNRRRRERREPFVPTGVFAAGYLSAWGMFSLAATLAQLGLDRVGLLSPMMAAKNPVFGGLVLIAAGLFQITPLKHACLDKCRSPLDFVLNRWRDGPAGAFAMGLDHGIYCLGCCWLLMVLMFVGGVMNLLWMAGLTVVVFVEKLVPRGDWFARLAGIAMTAAGVYLLAAI